MNNLGTTFCFGTSYADFKFIYVYKLLIFRSISKLLYKNISKLIYVVHNSYDFFYGTTTRNHKLAI